MYKCKYCGSQVQLRFLSAVEVRGQYEGHGSDVDAIMQQAKTRYNIRPRAARVSALQVIATKSLNALRPEDAAGTYCPGCGRSYGQGTRVTKTGHEDKWLEHVVEYSVCHCGSVIEDLSKALYCPRMGFLVCGRCAPTRYCQGCDVTTCANIQPGAPVSRYNPWTEEARREAFNNRDVFGEDPPEGQQEDQGEEFFEEEVEEDPNYNEDFNEEEDRDNR